MKQTPTSLARILLPLLLLAGVLLLWGLGLLGGGADPPAFEETSADLQQEGSLVSDQPAEGTTSQPGEESASTLIRTESEVFSDTLPQLQVLSFGGQAVAGVEVVCFEVQGSERDLFAFFDYLRPPASIPLGVTDAKGRVALPISDAPSLGFAVQSPDWLAVGETTFSYPFQEDIQLFVTPGGVVTGQVVDAHGPVAGASLGTLVVSDFLFGGDEDPVVRELYWDPANYRYATTDAEGRFRIEGLLPSSKRLDVIAPGCPPVRHAYEGPLAHQVRDVGTITVAPGLAVTFHVLSPEPLEEGTRLFLEAKGKEFTRGIAGLPLDAEGKLKIEGMRAGAYRWVLLRPQAVGMVGDLRIPPEGGVVSLEVSGLREVTVDVLDSAGMPIPNFTLEAEERMGVPLVVHGESQVRVRCGIDADLRVSARAEGYVSTKDHVVPPSKDSVVITMQRFGSLTCLLPEVEDGRELELGWMEARGDNVGFRMLASGFGVPQGKKVTVMDGQVSFEQVIPGAYRLVLDHGGGPTAGAVFEVFPEQTTTVEVRLPELKTLEGMVVEDDGGTPLAGVSVRLWGNEDPSFMLTMTGAFQTSSPVHKVSDQDGRFTFSLLPEAYRFVHLELPGYEPLIVSVDAQNHSPVIFRMRPLPRIPLQVQITADRPAAHASISFGQFPSGMQLPKFLGSAELDAEGKALLQDIPEGECDFHASFDWEPGVHYTLPHGDVHLQNDVPLRITLLENPGWISLSTPPLEDIEQIEIRDVDRPGTKDFVVRCTDGKWNPSLPLAPGKYRLTATGRGQSIHTACTIRAGATTPVDWVSEVQDLRVALLGNAWQRAQLRVKVVDGANEGAYRDFKMTSDQPSVAITGLPIGKLEVQLVEWWDEEGTGQRMRWTKELPAGATSVVFAVEDFATATITVVNEVGEPLPNTLIRALFGETGADGHVANSTDSEGKLSLLLKGGTIILQAYHPEFPLQSQRRSLRGDETWTVRMKK